MVEFTVYYRPDHGWQRLLEQPHDVLPRDPALRGRMLRDAGPRSRGTFDRYRGDLLTALSIAAPWWEATIAAQESRGLDRTEAVRISFDRRAAGAASHPHVVWIVRTYWLECAGLGEADLAEHVYPEEMLLAWLGEAEETELVRLVTCMPYWPIGLDADGRWV